MTRPTNDCLTVVGALALLLVGCDSPLESTVKLGAGTGGAASADGSAVFPDSGSGGASDARADSGDSAAPDGGSNACSGTGVDAATDAADTATILDPSGTYGGKTYAEWVAAYWKWFCELPGPEFPVEDLTGALCATGQPGATDGSAGANDAFFLTELPGGDGVVTRTCAVPAGKMILIPMGSYASFNIPGMLQRTDEEHQAICTALGESVTALALEIDGKCYGSTVSDFAQYLVAWTQFSFTVPTTPNNAFMTVWGSTYTGPIPVAYGGGYFLLLAPLLAGSHTIRFTLKCDAVQAFSAPPVSEDVTYHLVVQ